MSINIYRKPSLMVGMMLYLCLACSSVFADVDRRTGAFTFSSNGMNSLARHYNSKEKSSGLFGMGWMTMFDSHIKFQNEDLLYVLNVAKSGYHKFERDDNGLWQGRAGALQETEAGYIWTYNDEILGFDHSGLLVEYDVDGKKINLEYDEKDLLKRFYAKNDKDYAVKLDDKGRVLHIVEKGSSGDGNIHYSYKDKWLASEVNSSATVKYRYVGDGYLCYVENSGRDPVMISYEKFDNKMVVSSYTSGDEIETYQFKILSEVDDVKSFSVDYTFTTGDDETRSYRDEYDDVYVGDRYVYTKHQKKYYGKHMISDAFYTDQGDLSSVLKRGRLTTYKYDELNRLIRKKIGEKTHEYTYNNIGKISDYRYSNNNEKDSISWIKFKYDDNKNLIEAKNSEGEELALEYNNNGKIITMISDKNKVNLSYNTMGKPIRINVVGIGTINTSYDADGNIMSTNTEKNDHSSTSNVSAVYRDMFRILEHAN